MQKQVRIVPAAVLGRIMFLLIALSFAVVGLFFLAYALIAAAIIAPVVGTRLWWIRRKLHAHASAAIEGTYSVEPELRLPAFMKFQTEQPQKLDSVPTRSALFVVRIPHLS